MRFSMYDVAVHRIMMQVLFPLLAKVSEKTGAASTSSVQTAIMIHHSRDTEQKQWAETQVYTWNKRGCTCCVYMYM